MEDDFIEDIEFNLFCIFFKVFMIRFICYLSIFYYYEM